MKIRLTFLTLVTGWICLAGCARWEGGRAFSAPPTASAAAEQGAVAALQALDRTLADLVAGLDDLESIDVSVP